MLNIIIFIFLNITCMWMLATLIKIFLYKNKDKLQWTAFISVGLAFMWCSGMLAQVYLFQFFKRTSMFLVYYYCFGSYFLPSFLLIFTILYIKPEIKINHRFLLIFIFPIVFYLLVLTNKYHHYMYVKYAIDESVIFGKFTGLLGIYIYMVYLVIVGYLIYHRFNNFKLLSRQSLIIILSLFIPFTTNLIITFKTIPLPLYANATSACFTLLILYYGVIKYRFLEINPISQKVLMNAISDAFVVIDKKFNVTGYNNAFRDKFKYLEIDLTHNILNKINNRELNDWLIDSSKNRRINNLELEIIDDNSQEKFYIVDIIPIILKNVFLGLLVIFKDITEIHQMQRQTDPQ